jgi:hypothetical protein
MIALTGATVVPQEVQVKSTALCDDQLTFMVVQIMIGSIDRHILCRATVPPCELVINGLVLLVEVTGNVVTHFDLARRSRSSSATRQ